MICRPIHVCYIFLVNDFELVVYVKSTRRIDVKVECTVGSCDQSVMLRSQGAELILIDG